MTEWELLSRYNYFKLAAKDRRAFDRWQISAAVTASLFGLALLAMAVGAWLSPSPVTTAMAARQAETDGMSTRDLAVRINQDLPTQEIDSPF